MTVKIIGRGEQEVWRVSCGQCGAVLEYGRMDMKSEPQYGEEGDYVGESRWIDCPGCGSRVSVKLSDL